MPTTTVLTEEETSTVREQFGYFLSGRSKRGGVLELPEIEMHTDTHNDSHQDTHNDQHSDIGTPS